mgnify:FL=1
MINNHKLMGENILKYSNAGAISLINKNRFIWGNVKPDCVPQYKRIRHYFDESIDMVINKILYLSSLTIYDVHYGMSMAKFSEELGVICHFLCDYFCAPHHYRWECTSTKIMKDHMLYEKRLAKKTKTFIPGGILIANVTKDFLIDLQKEYENVIGFNNDLTFAYYVCDSILNMILNNVLTNESRIKKVI